jgi:hypothetical protein
MKKINLKNLLRQEINPTVKTLIIGPGSIRSDPSTYFVRQIVNKGKVIAIDLKKAMDC